MNFRTTVKTIKDLMLIIVNDTFPGFCGLYPFINMAERQLTSDLLFFCIDANGMK